MKSLKRIVSTLLITALFLGGTDLFAFNVCLDRFLNFGRIVSYAEEIATQSEFKKKVPGTSDMKAWYVKCPESTSSVYFKDRNGSIQYRVYGKGSAGLGWYKADEYGDPTDPEIRTDTASPSEYMTDAPIQYRIYQSDEYTSAIWNAFYEAEPDFANEEKTELRKWYKADWDGTYKAPYLKKDEDNIYKVSGAWKLHRDGESSAIYYIAYGKILNDGEEGELQWFIFEDGVGLRYQATLSGATSLPYDGVIRGAVAKSGDSISLQNVTGYKTPSEGIKVTSDGQELSPKYSAKSWKLKNYSKKNGNYIETSMEYDALSSKLSEDSAHDNYNLKLYCYK